MLQRDCVQSFQTSKLIFSLLVVASEGYTMFNRVMMQISVKFIRVYKCKNTIECYSFCLKYKTNRSCNFTKLYRKKRERKSTCTVHILLHVCNRWYMDGWTDCSNHLYEKSNNLVIQKNSIVNFETNDYRLQ